MNTDDYTDAFIRAFDDADSLRQQILDSDLEIESGGDSSRYIIGGLLGEGAAKRVYLAHDTIIQRDVAYAVLKADTGILADDFLKEVRLTASLEHPNISPVHDMGTDSSGQPFFIMKLYEGKTLSEMLNDRCSTLDDEGVRPCSSMSVSDLLDIFVKVCDAVSYAHSQGILHLDIKPSNIRINDYGEVLLCDWGISRIAATTDVHHDSSINITPQPAISRATIHGEIQGTPGFMAPEQQTKKVPCSVRTDVYGLGALLHNLMNGKAPNELAETKTLMFPRELQAICSKALSDDQSDRYVSVHELMQDIDKYRNGLVTMAENATLFQILSKWFGRHKRTCKLVLLNACIVAVCITLYLKSVRHSEQKANQLEKQLNSVMVTSHQENLSHAQRLYENASALYESASKQHVFKIHDIEVANAMAKHSLQLDPSNRKCWSLIGELNICLSRYQEAQTAFEKSPEYSKKALTALKAFMSEKINGETTNQQFSRLITEFHAVEHRQIRNHLIFKRIQELEGKDNLFSFSMEAMKIVNNAPDMKWKYDELIKSLDISGNNIFILSPIRKLRLERLIVRNGKLKSYELHNLRWSPITELDVAYNNIDHLNYLLNEEVETLNIEGNPIRNFSALTKKKIKELNIVNTTNNPKVLSTLSECDSLVTITCSEKQADYLKTILPKRVTFIVQN